MNHLHYCRHCDKKIEASSRTSAHILWMGHYHLIHQDIAAPIRGVSPDGNITRCNPHCLGQPLPDELTKGERIWGTHPDSVRISPSNPLQIMNEILGPED